eukprot:6476433-Amphidinium_carterae.1
MALEVLLKVKPASRANGRSCTSGRRRNNPHVQCAAQHERPRSGAHAGPRECQHPGEPQVVPNVAACQAGLLVP